MKDVLKDLIAQVFIILVPVLLYQPFWKAPINKSNKQRKVRKIISTGVICSITAAMCMFYTISIFNGHFIDLRIVPLIISIWYGGLAAGILVLLTILGIRFIIGGSGLVITIITVSAAFIVSLLLRENFKNASLVMKTYIGVTIALLYTLLKITLTDIFITDNASPLIFLPTLLIFSITLIVTMYLLIYFIENLKLRETQKLMSIKREKRQVVAQLAASIAHEILNPLTAVKGFLKLYLTNNTRVQDVNYIRLALIETEKAEVITSDYLSLADPQIDFEEVIPIHGCIDDIKNIFAARTVDRNIVLEFNISNDFYVLGNYDKFKKVLIKIIQNAIDASDSNSKVSISVNNDNDHVQITVDDLGKGMSQEELERLGLPFYSLKENGVGLSIMFCYKIVGLMNGQLSFKSSEGIGTTVTLLFPKIQK